MSTFLSKSGSGFSEDWPTGSAWFTPELFRTVCERIGEGDTVRNCSRELGFNKGHFWTKIQENPKLVSLYMRAREDQAHDHFERINELAGMCERGEIDPNAARVAIDARKWAACKLLPKSYGEKVELAGSLVHEFGDSITSLVISMRHERKLIETQSEQHKQLPAS